ncbi:MAG: hypothetical protein E3K32_01600 [wastewater metagenome]|nr:hypothetical protein [Candidatus Loosdrechtia aerotolerans]
MFKKIGIIAIITGTLMFGINAPRSFAQKPGCPEDCKCGPDVPCEERGCVKEKTNTCFCGEYEYKEMEREERSVRTDIQGISSQYEE